MQRTSSHKVQSRGDKAETKERKEQRWSPAKRRYVTMDVSRARRVEMSLRNNQRPQSSRERILKGCPVASLLSSAFQHLVPPSSLTQHLVLVKTAHWISRIKRTCREHSILWTSLNYLGLFTTLRYRVRTWNFANTFTIYTSQHHSNSILCPQKD